MSSAVVIKIENISKAYAIWSSPAARLHGPLVGQIGQWAFLPARARQLCRRLSHEAFRNFMALNDVSLEIRQGENFGIIGRNGSGKSTLLQIIAGIIQPTTGAVTVTGKVAALLELGSGFNPEFTGRENVYLNAAIHGMSQDETDARFAEIEAFADIGDFIDQPTKTYSSGMLVRLAFAVTTSVNADVLLIDEALAVGDVFFRQKCYKHLERLRNNGISVVLVSHGMGEVEQFCQRALLLHHGANVFLGNATETVRRYYLLAQQDHTLPKPATLTEPTPSLTGGTGIEWPTAEAFLDISTIPQVSNGWARCTAVALCNQTGQACAVFEQGHRASFFYEFELLMDIEVPIGGVVLQNDKGMVVHGKGTLEYGTAMPPSLPRGCRLRFHQEILLELGIGEYTFEVGLGVLHREDYERRQIYPYSELCTKWMRVCHLPNVGQFAVVFRKSGQPVQLLHHGVANLSGSCRVAALIPTVKEQRE